MDGLLLGERNGEVMKELGGALSFESMCRTIGAVSGLYKGYYKGSIRVLYRGLNG